MDVIDLIGRVLFASVFVVNGWAHLAHREMIVGVARGMGAPAPELTAPAAGVLMLVSSALIVLGVWADLAALALVPFLFATAVLAHAYWKEEDPMTRAGQHAQFWKNIGLAGAALYIVATFTETDLTLGSPLF